ncbi:MAG: hypothetical protein AAF587_41130 [Bacteroidota bacterium]
MKTQAEYYQQHQALTDDELIHEYRGINAYCTVRENGYEGPTRPNVFEEKKALEQLLEERGLEKPEMVFGDIFRLELPSEMGSSEAEQRRRLPEDVKTEQKSTIFGEEVTIEKDFLNKGIIQIVLGLFLAFIGIGLSLDMKGFLFYGAIFGGIGLIVLGGMNIHSYRQLK